MLQRFALSVIYSYSTHEDNHEYFSGFEYIEKWIEYFPEFRHQYCQDYGSALIANSLFYVDYEALDKEGKERLAKIYSKILKFIRFQITQTTVKNFLTILIRARNKEYYFETINLDLELKSFLSQLSSKQDDPEIQRQKQDLLTFSMRKMEYPDEPYIGENDSAIVFEHFVDEIDFSEEK